MNLEKEPDKNLIKVHNFTDKQLEDVDYYLEIAKEKFNHIPEGILKIMVQGYIMNPQKFKDDINRKAKPRDTQEEYDKYCKMNDSELDEYIKNLDNKNSIKTF